MKFSRRVLLACAAALISSGAFIACAEEPANHGDQAQAVVHIYRYRQFVGAALRPSVYCDDRQLARLENGTFMTRRIAAGQHTFRSNDKQSGVVLDLKPGEEYYIRVELVPGMFKGHGRVVLASKEQGAFEVGRLRPLDGITIANR